MENRLTALPPGVFDGLGSLRDLWLYYNRLTALAGRIRRSRVTEVAEAEQQPSHGAGAGRVRRSRVTEGLCGWTGTASRRWRRACSPVSGH